MLGIKTDNSRNLGLDALRVLAIFCVLHGHARGYLDNTILDFAMLLPLPRGVDIFFVLSGFLIGKSFIGYVEKNNGVVGCRKPVIFYLRTALRILPDYLFMLIVNYLLVNLEVINGDTHEFPVWRFATFTQNIFTPFWNFFWESWSLSVQWWFYILFPLLLAILCRHITPSKAVPIISGFFIVGSLVYRAVVSDMVCDNFSWDIWLRKTVASRCDNIYFGVMAAYVHHYYHDFWERHAEKFFVIGITMFLCLRMIPKPIGSFYYNVVYLSLPPVYISLCLPLICKMRSCNKVVTGIISHISVLSYAMFLTNVLVGQIINLHFAYSGRIDGCVLYLAFWTLTILSAYCLYIIVEKPFTMLRDNLFSRNS